MIQYREISVKEAMDMIVQDDWDNLYFKTSQGAIDCVKDYSIKYAGITKKQYFRKETIK